LDETRSPPPKPLTETLAALRQTPVRAADVVGLSDLDRAGARLLAAEWATLPEPARIAAVRQMDELAEERLDLSFGRALRVALVDPSPVVRQLAVAALWEDEADDLLTRFRELLDADPSQDVRAEAATGLGRFAERAAQGELDPAVGADLRQILLATASDPVSPYLLRRRALEAVGAFCNDAEVRELIGDAYESADQGLQASALRAMGRNLDRRWLDVVLAELRSPEAELRFEAAQASGALGDTRAIPELAELALEQDAEVRLAAIAALGQIGGQGAVRVLRNLAADARESDAELIDAALEEALTGLEPLRTPS
jgi:HEAT repeat protein